MPRWLLSAICALLLCLWQPSAALAIDDPSVLPDQPTPVIDLARILTDSQRKNLEQELEGVEAKVGWKLRVLTQFDQTPGLAVRDFWQLDERSLLLIADPRGGNLLNFNVGDAFFALMPRTYWVELQTRFGNQFYVRDHGEDGAIFDALEAVEICLERGGCQVVPGLPKTRSGKIMRRILRQVACGAYEDLGDVSTLADPSVVAAIVAGHRQDGEP